jgi:hypothetical protein
MILLNSLEQIKYITTGTNANIIGIIILYIHIKFIFDIRFSKGEKITVVIIEFNPEEVLIFQKLLTKTLFAKLYSLLISHPQIYEVTKLV